MHVKILQKSTLLEVWPANLAVRIYVLPITLKQLNGLTSIDRFSCLGGQEVTLQTGMREVTGSNPGVGKEFYVCFFVLLLLFCPKIIIYVFFAYFEMLMHLRNLTYCKIIWVSRYIPSIFNDKKTLYQTLQNEPRLNILPERY